MDQPQRPPDRPLAAALWMTGSIAAFCAMAVAARAISHRHDTFEILAYRSVVGLILVLGIGTLLGQRHRITAARLPSHALRNVFHFTGQALWFWALTMIPLAQVFALEFTSPLWVLLLSALFLKERLTRPRLVAAALGFAGVLIVANPDFGRIDAGVLAAAACAFFFASSILMTKRLTKGEAVISILFWLTAFQSVFGLALSLQDGAITLPDSQTLPWLLLIGCGGLLAHLCLTTALSLAPASFVAPVDFARLPVIAAIGAVFYAEPVGAGLALGAGLILLGNWLSLRAESRAPAQQSNPHDSVTPRH